MRHGVIAQLEKFFEYHHDAITKVERVLLKCHLQSYGTSPQPCAQRLEHTDTQSCRTHKSRSVPMSLGKAFLEILFFGTGRASPQAMLPKLYQKHEHTHV